MPVVELHPKELASRSNHRDGLGRVLTRHQAVPDVEREPKVLAANLLREQKRRAGGGDLL